jgi:hypothetical protein
MKLIIASAIALSATVPAFADTSAQQFFALSNDSAAERIVHTTSVGDVAEAQIKFAMQNESAAEANLITGDNTVTRGAALEAKSFFKMFNDSAAETN